MTSISFNRHGEDATLDEVDEMCCGEPRGQLSTTASCMLTPRWTHLRKHVSIKLVGHA